ncbi:MAG: hypothetical protein ABSF45_21460 [Terriglobia bacterium]
MELLEFSAGTYWRLAGLLGQLLMRLDAAKAGVASLPDSTYRFLGSTLGEAMLELKKLGLSLSLKKVERIKESLDEGGAITLDQLHGDIAELHERIIDELESQLFLAVPESKKKYYSSLDPFGKSVADRFPSAIFDAAEAGRCYALNRNTACVFHLMRVMEIGVQKLGDKLGVKLATEKNWQNILDEVNKAIKSLDPRAEATKQLSASAAHLYAIKVAWRNEVMHPKATYTEEEADAIFKHVNTFVNHLVYIM